MALWIEAIMSNKTLAKIKEDIAKLKAWDAD
jgi:hypothetical protein